MSNKKQTVVEWLFEQIDNKDMGEIPMWVYDFIEQAKEMDKQQQGYTKEDVIKAGGMGEICYLDTEHIVSYLDEAREANEQYYKETRFK